MLVGSIGWGIEYILQKLFMDAVFGVRGHLGWQSRHNDNGYDGE